MRVRPGSTATIPTWGAMTFETSPTPPLGVLGTGSRGGEV